MKFYDRKTPRARRYDYSAQGMYFITICTDNRVNYFGNIVNGEVHLSDLGKICEIEISRLNERSNIELHEWIIMPDHLHLLLFMKETKTSDTNLNKKDSKENDKSIYLGRVMNIFKGNISKYSNKHNIDFSRQPRYHDRIVRNEKEYDNIKYYIQNNPKNENEEIY
ncbi:MAG: transposase [Candidatus Absconditabacteria bacterium]